MVWLAQRAGNNQLTEKWNQQLLRQNLQPAGAISYKRYFVPKVAGLRNWLGLSPADTNAISGEHTPKWIAFSAHNNFLGFKGMRGLISLSDALEDCIRNIEVCTHVYAFVLMVLSYRNYLFI